jgi:hypothetical protein
MRVIMRTLLQVVALTAPAAAAETGHFERRQNAPIRAVIATGVDWPCMWDDAQHESETYEGLDAQ